MADAVPVAAEGAVELLPIGDRNGTVAVYSQRYFVDLGDRRCTLQWGVKLSRIQDVSWIERRLDQPHPQDRVVIEVKIFATEATTVLTPQHPAKARYKRMHLVGDRSQQPLVGLVVEVKSGSNVDAPDVGMTEHAVAQAVRVEQPAIAGNELLEAVRWHRTIFDKRDRTPAADSLTEQTNSVGADLPDRGNLRGVGRGRHRGRI